MELWLGLRNQLEVDKDPFDSVFKFWNNVPTSKIIIDPYDKERWPDPW